MRRLNSEQYTDDVKSVFRDEIDWKPLQYQTMLITGATGMIGTAMIDALMYLNLQKKAEILIIAVGRSSERAKQRFEEYWNDSHFLFVEQDINQPMKMGGGFCDINGETIKKIDYIIHGASTTHPRAYAEEPVQTITSNVMGLSNLLEYGKENHVKRVVFLSSVEIYGENRGDTDTFLENYCGYIDCNTLRAGYPESKRVGEALCQAYAKQYGVEVVIPRLSRIYGPTMLDGDSKAIAQFINKAINHENIILKSDGNQFYSYCYVMDAVKGILTVMLSGESGQAYNISDSNSEISLKDLAKILANVSDTEVIFELPDEIEKAGYSKATRAILNTSKLELLGWSARTPIVEGLCKTVQILAE